MTKQELRRQMICRRKSMTAEEMRQADRTITEKILQSDRYREAESLFIYVSMPGEADTRTLIRDALDLGKRVCVPKCLTGAGKSGGHMEAKEIRKLSDLSCLGAYGIPEPGPDCPTVSPDRIDLALVPCLSASHDGRRLGHGAGCYDRFLAESRAFRLCICYDKLLSEDQVIPMDPYDLYMDQVITDECTLGT